ncbi:MAG: sigma-70 family RNA polymerase sigma factor [Roseivirga sp.]|nr:sigma-70 family RNA polymerase sigma factor [Roseivirga sp.]
MPAHESKKLTEHFFRHNYARTVAILVKYFGLKQVEIAEDIVQDTLVEAMEKWSIHSIPDNPEGWIMDVAKKKTINLLKRQTNFQSKIIPNLNQSKFENEAEIADSTLQMIFACCHPDLPSESQIALALKTLCGLSIPEIARALMSSEENINKRLYRAKRKFRDGTITLESTKLMNHNRLNNTLQVLYLLFNEGYFSAHHSCKIRLELCYEAIRLLTFIDEASPSGKVNGLLAMMYLSVARFESRISPLGELILLEEQDRSMWDMELMAKGMRYLSESIRTKEVNSYQIQAGIIAEYCLAEDFRSTNWESICLQYELLETLEQHPILTLNKAISMFHAGQQREALELIDQLHHDPFLSKNAQLALAHAVLLRASGEGAKADCMFQTALTLATTDNEKELIMKRMS